MASVGQKVAKIKSTRTDELGNKICSCRVEFGLVWFGLVLFLVGIIL